MKNLNAADFFAMVDRNIRNENLDFEKVCKHRSDDELVDTLRHWQGQFACRRQETFVKILKAEINDRINGVYLMSPEARAAL